MKNKIVYRIATMEELDFLIELRKKELALFSDVPLSPKTVEKTYFFYQDKMKKKECFTILGYDDTLLVTTGTVYFYDTMPSNNNHSGKTGYITNIWTKEEYRGNGLASDIMDQLMILSKQSCGILCLNASDEAKSLYTRKGFVCNDKNMVYQWKK